MLMHSVGMSWMAFNFKVRLFKSLIHTINFVKSGNQTVIRSKLGKSE